MTLAHDLVPPRRILELSGVSKAYGATTVLDHIDLTVREGEFIGLIGPNGAGKTTLLEIIEGVNPLTSGDVRLLGENPRELSPATRGRVGLVFQRHALPGYVNVRQLVDIFQSSLRVSVEDSGLLAAKLGLAHLWGRKLGQLSVGQQQRVAVFIALLGQRELIMLDEPTSALDLRSRHAVWDTLLERKRGGKLTGILATHNMDEAAILCDRLCFLRDGRIAAQGPISQFTGDGRILSLKFWAPDAFVTTWQALNDPEVEISGVPGHYEVICPRQRLPGLLGDLLEAEQTLGFSANIAISELDLERTFMEVCSANA
ncbi:ABC transporter ATP-binding protein [Xanthomonas albilineans]|uniref:ABC transporter ATP-binding protein n=1 Tax=Xanthomonas albilineans TaxID=29447 RepID=UPI00069858DB|nr:ABC transporter ATP-binding protein [Xanthomonas albilineans]